VLWRGEGAGGGGAEEGRGGLQGGCCGEERWAAVWVMWRGEMGCSVDFLPYQELDPKSHVFQHKGSLSINRNKLIFCTVECWCSWNSAFYSFIFLNLSRLVPVNWGATMLLLLRISLLAECRCIVHWLRLITSVHYAVRLLQSFDVFYSWKKCSFFCVKHTFMFYICFCLYLILLLLVFPEFLVPDGHFTWEMHSNARDSFFSPS
jgi:hypothetical protein